MSLQIDDGPHCGNDCLVGTREEDDGLEPIDCEHCPCCCDCTPCTYAPDRAQREGTWAPGQWQR